MPRYRLPTVLASLALSPLVVTGACGGSSQPPPAQQQQPVASATVAPSASAAPPEPPPLTAVPTECEDKAAKHCVPPVRFVKKLCGAHAHLWVALAMFQKGTPWPRMYMTRDSDPYNALGGHSSQDKLLWDEEVLILAHQEAPKGQIQVSGAGASYDILRWDGTCARVQEVEVTARIPGKIKYAKVAWRDIDQELRDAFHQDEALAKVSHKRKNECKGASIGGVTAACEKLDKQLTQAIIDYVKKGGKVPAPAKLP